MTALYLKCSITDEHIQPIPSTPRLGTPDPEKRIFTLTVSQSLTRYTYTVDPVV